MDGFEVFMACLVLAVVAIGASMVGAEAYDTSWQKDCAALGMHRTKDSVFICHKQ